MRRVIDLFTIVVIGVILAEILRGFYNGYGSLAPYGGGSGVILSGITNIATTTVDAMLGQVGPTTPSGPNPPASQKTPAPKSVPKPPSTKKPKKQCGTVIVGSTDCCSFEFFGKCPFG
jgi:hypothetical protein